MPAGFGHRSWSWCCGLSAQSLAPESLPSSPGAGERPRWGSLVPPVAAGLGAEDRDDLVGGEVPNVVPVLAGHEVDTTSATDGVGCPAGTPLIRAPHPRRNRGWMVSSDAVHAARSSAHPRGPVPTPPATTSGPAPSPVTADAPRANLTLLIGSLGFLPDHSRHLDRQRRAAQYRQGARRRHDGAAVGDRRVHVDVRLAAAVRRQPVGPHRREKSPGLWDRPVPAGVDRLRLRADDRCPDRGPVRPRRCGSTHAAGVDGADP